MNNVTFSLNGFRLVFPVILFPTVDGFQKLEVPVQKSLKQESLHIGVYFLGGPLFLETLIFGPLECLRNTTVA